MKYNKGFAPVLVLIIVLGVLAVGGGAYFMGKSSAPKNKVNDNSNYFPPVDQNYTPPTTNNNVTPPITAKPSITVISPNGGEVWKRDTTQIIKWSSQNSLKTTHVDVRLVRTNGSSPATTAYIVKNINIDQQAYTWKVGYTYSSLFNPINNDAVLEFPADGQYKIQICENGTNNCDSSNSYFTMTTQDTTSNLKTYTNTQYGFEFKYPANFNLTSGDGSYSIVEMTKGVCVIQISQNVGTGLSEGSSFEDKEINIAGKILTERSIFNSNKTLVRRSISEIFPGYQILAWSQSSPSGIEPCINDFNIFLSTFKFTTAPITVAGVQKYTDSNLGFSFWYPNTWNIQQSSATYSVIAGGSITKKIVVAPIQYPNEGIAIEEFVSTDKSITDNSNCGPADGCPSSVRYYFDSNTHTWMKESRYDYPGASFRSPTIAPADVSKNSMGGLHILQGNARFGDNTIVPLSAKNFLVVHNMSAGTNRIEFLAKTIVASDPAVATPWSNALQTQTIQAELSGLVPNYGN